MIKDKTPDTKDKLVWKWLKGQTTTKAEFGDPIASAVYKLCIYSGATEDLVSQAVVPSGTLWKAISNKGYKYKDKFGTSDGVTKVVLKGKGANKSKALVKGKGVNVDIPPDASDSMKELDLPVRVQLVNGDNGICFEADYQIGDIKKNVPGKFKAKAQ